MKIAEMTKPTFFKIKDKNYLSTCSEPTVVGTKICLSIDDGLLHNIPADVDTECGDYSLKAANEHTMLWWD